MHHACMHVCEQQPSSSHKLGMYMSAAGTDMFLVLGRVYADTRGDSTGTELTIVLQLGHTELIRFGSTGIPQLVQYLKTTKTTTQPGEQFQHGAHKTHTH